MASEINPFGLRMPAPLRLALLKKSQAALRSLNAEIVLRLERSLAEESGGALPEYPADDLGATVMRNKLEQTLIKRFRGLTAQKRKALLELINPGEK